MLASVLITPVLVRQREGLGNEAWVMSYFVVRLTVKLYNFA